MKLLRLALPILCAAALGGCSLSGLLGGGKAPPTLLRLNPEAAPVVMQRSAAAGNVVTVRVPEIGEELRTNRIPVHVSPYDVQYVTGLQWVDTPSRLFQDLLSETIRRRTNRIVLSPDNAVLDPGLIITGQLQRFGYDEAAASVVVIYDATIASQGGTRVDTRRFEARVPSGPEAAAIGAALNRAANQVALETAAWIGG